MSLLEQAKKIKVKDTRPIDFTKEEVELFVAYMNGEIGRKQLTSVYRVGKSVPNFLNVAVSALRQGVAAGLVNRIEMN